MRELLRTMTVGVVAATLVFVTASRSGASSRALAATILLLSGAAATIWLRFRAWRWSAAAAAGALEAARPQSRNLIVTADELLRHPERARPEIQRHVLEQAVQIIGTRRGSVVALKPEVLAAGGVVLAALAVVLGLPQRAAIELQEALDPVATRRGSRVRGLDVAATLTPPGYTGEKARTLQNPDRIDAIEGTRLQLAFQGDGDWKARFGADALTATDTGDRRVVEMVLARSGYLAIDSADPALAASRRLVPVTVTPDRAPTIQIEAPAKDLLLPDATPTIPVTATATDDFGLQSLDLRYTKISGSGEQFEFEEGTLPLAIAPGSNRSWKARGRIALPALRLAPGDSVVYRVVGRDLRPGTAGVSSSDTFFIEVAGPGQVALAGFELPPERERYALSQQMIVLKLERLKAREAAIGRPALEEDVATIAAEQRAVKANFVFLTGGHVEDEEEEAEHSNEIQEGRLANTARQEIARAIQFMTLTEQALAQVSPGTALPPAQAAVAALQRAFGRNRYFLRTLPVRSRVDPSRRLTGDLASASDWRRELFPATPEANVERAQVLLARVLEMAPAIRAGSVPAAALTAFAEEALASNPESPEWQTISRSFLAIRDEAMGDQAQRSSSLNAIVTTLGSVIQRRALTARPLESSSSSLRAAWGEERRRR
jgi:hypothetical protein